MTEQHPLDKLSEERIDALINNDWDRYNAIGQKIVELLDERKSLTGEDPRIDGCN